MSNVTLIIGETGTGKSTSLRNLNAQETFIINVLDKPLPFRGYSKSYQLCTPDFKEGNYFASDNHTQILRAIDAANQRKDIKNIIIDDWQYTMCNEYLRRANETGYQKFTEIAQHAQEIIRRLICGRSDMYCFVLSHNDRTDDGKYKCKSIGKLLDEKISVEGMFTVVLHSMLNDGRYVLLTKNNGIHVAKSPFGMFDQEYIDNDLKEIKLKMEAYFSYDVPDFASNDKIMELSELAKNRNIAEEVAAKHYSKNRTLKFNEMYNDEVQNCINYIKSKAA